MNMSTIDEIMTKDEFTEKFSEELCEIYDEELAEYEDEHGIDHS